MSTEMMGSRAFAMLASGISESVRGTKSAGNATEREPMPSARGPVRAKRKSFFDEEGDRGVVSSPAAGAY